MPIFLERFVIGACAALLITLIVNPLKFDLTQRITLAVALVLFAYFAAHTIHKSRLPTTATTPESQREPEAKDREIAQLRDQKRQLEDKMRATRISVDFTDGWYALAGPNSADPTTASAHFRLRLSVANRDDRNTTLSFQNLRVPVQSGLVLKQVKLYPETISPPTLMRAVNMAAGQTLATILEAHVSFPNMPFTGWGNTVRVQIDLSETFRSDPITLTIDVPRTP